MGRTGIRYRNPLELAKAVREQVEGQTDGETAYLALAAPFDDGGVGVADGVADLPGIHHVREWLQEFIVKGPELFSQGWRHILQRYAAGLPGQAFQAGDHVGGSDHVFVSGALVDPAGDDAVHQQHPGAVLADLAQPVELFFGDRFGVIPQDAFLLFLLSMGLTSLLFCQRQEASRLLCFGSFLSRVLPIDASFDTRLAFSYKVGVFCYKKLILRAFPFSRFDIPRKKAIITV